MKQHKYLGFIEAEREDILKVTFPGVEENGAFVMRIKFADKTVVNYLCNYDGRDA